MEKNVEKNLVILKDTYETFKNGEKVIKEREWKEKKCKTSILADSYERLGMEKKSFRVRECGTFLEFRRYKSDNSIKLNWANFCKDRLCPMCSWRRGMKIFGQVSRIMDKALEEKPYRFLFLTLTVKNCEGKDLKNTIDYLFKSYKKFTERKKIKDIVLGSFRALEVTHDIDKYITKESYKKRYKTLKKMGLRVGDLNYTFDTYHPHFHVILMVNKSYFNDKKKYLNHEDFVKIWSSCLGVERANLDIRAFKTDTKSSTSKSIAESAKYTVKDNEYLLEDDEILTDDAVYILHNALKGRRLVHLGGKFLSISKQLKLDDIENGDLIHTDNENLEDFDDKYLLDKDTGELLLREDIEYMIERYFWHIGYSNYVKK